MADARDLKSLDRKVMWVRLPPRAPKLDTMQSIKAAIKEAQAQPAAYVVSPLDLSYLYKGSCRKLIERLKDHQAGRVSRTKNRRPLGLVYFEYCESFSDARKREDWLKSGAGRRFLQEQIQVSTNET